MLRGETLESRKYKYLLWGYAFIMNLTQPPNGMTEGLRGDHAGGVISPQTISSSAPAPTILYLRTFDDLPPLRRDLREAEMNEIYQVVVSPRRPRANKIVTMKN